MRHANRSVLLVLGSNWLVLFLLISWNDYWVRHGIYFHLPGLFFLFGATRLDNRRGIVVAVLTGLLIDSSTPSPFGLHAFGLTLCHLIAREGGEGMRYIRGQRPIVHQQAANLFLIVTLSIWSLTQSPEGASSALGRLATDTLASQLFLLPAGMWFLAFQDKLLLYAGVELTEKLAAE